MANRAPFGYNALWTTSAEDSMLRHALTMLLLVSLVAACETIDNTPLPPPTTDTVDTADPLDADLDASSPDTAQVDTVEIDTYVDMGPSDLLPDAPQVVLDDDYSTVVLGLINGAEESIRIAHYYCNDDYLVSSIKGALVAAAMRGVDVQAVFDDDPDDTPGCIQYLQEGGVVAAIDSSSRTTHAKLIVVDERYVLGGSTNWSVISMKYNHEANVALDDELIGAAAAAYIDDLAASSSGLVLAPPVTSGQVTMFFDATYKSQALPLIEAATQSIRLVIYAMTYDPDYPYGDSQILMEALMDAASRGVEVKVILERSDFDWGLNNTNDYIASVLEGGGVDVRRDTEETITHAKVLVVDGEAFVGTNNWTYSGLEKNHEVGFHLTDLGLAEELKNYFESIWNESN